jgi:hypothetical protein
MLPPDFFGENLIYVPAVPDIVDFHGARVFVDTINDPVTPGAEREVTRHIALKAFSRMRLLRQELDRSFDQRLQRRRQPKNLPAAVGRID